MMTNIDILLSRARNEYRPVYSIIKLNKNPYVHVKHFEFQESIYVPDMYYIYCPFTKSEYRATLI